MLETLLQWLLQLSSITKMNWKRSAAGTESCFLLVIQIPLANTPFSVRHGVKPHLTLDTSMKHEKFDFSGTVWNSTLDHAVAL